MNNKLLALILILSVTIVNFNNCADKDKKEAEAKQDNLAELIEEFNDLKEQAKNAHVIHMNNLKPHDVKKFKEKVLSLFDKFNNALLKQKVVSVKGDREGLIKAGLYPQDKINLEGPVAIKVFEDALQDQFYDMLKEYFFNIVDDIVYYTSMIKKNNVLDFIQVFPIKIGNKVLTLSDIFNFDVDHKKRYQALSFFIDSELSADQAAQFLIKAYGKYLNKPLLNKENESESLGAPLLIDLVLVYKEAFNEADHVRKVMERNEKEYSSDPKFAARLNESQKDILDIALNKIEKLANVIKVLLKLPEIDIDAKDSKGLNFANYANEKDGNGDYVNPELHQIYQEHMAYIKQRQDALKEGLKGALPVPALRDLAAGYVN